MLAEEQVRSLISQYQVVVRRATQELQVNHQAEINDWGFAINGRRAKSGRLSPTGGEFRPHGIGCAFEFDGWRADVDYGPDGRCDGFDVWRLALFSESNAGVPKVDENTIKAVLNHWEAAGIIRHFSESPGSHLFFFVREPVAVGLPDQLSAAACGIESR